VGLSRRALIKQAGAAAFALGLSDLAIHLGLLPQAKAYGQALAQPAGRKLALLIGINNYPERALSAEGDAVSKLAGCTTDVSLQKELLIHRFGFLPSDIVCLTNAQATRAGIYEAFADHLYAQAQPEDVVVFHFSGCGAQVRIEDALGGQSTVRSLIPADGLLPTEARPAINDILEIELKALLSLINTQQITTVLDAGFVDVAVPLAGGLRSRSRSAIATGQPPAPFPLLVNSQRLGQDGDPFPGVLLRAAAVDNVVVERQWDGFHAGAFTYVLTQYLWTAPVPATVGEVLGRSQETLMRWGGSNQQPEASGSRNLDLIHLEKTPEKTPSIYSTPLLDGFRGEGVIQSISADGKTATLWLGGLTPRVLEYLGPSAVMECAGRKLKLKSRSGLVGKATIIDFPGSPLLPLQPGQPVFEAVRRLPKSLDLIVALDAQLARIERVDATSALSALAFVSSTSDTDLPADCLLGKPLAGRLETLTASLRPTKVSPKASSQSAAQSVAQTASSDSSRESSQDPAPLANPTDTKGESGYGLFSLTRSLIPGTLALQDEAIKPAISRLVPKLQSLLALKLLRLSENRASSKLSVRVTLEMVSPQSKQLFSRQTLRASSAPNLSQNAPGQEGFIPQVPLGSRARYHLFNDGETPLYYTLINVNARERLSAFCPVVDVPAAKAEQPKMDRIAATAIAPGSSIAIPSPDLDWAIDAPPGPVETYVVCSTLPLTQTFSVLLSASINSGSQRVDPLPNPLAVVEALLSDLNQGDHPDAYALDVSQWATLNFTYQAVQVV
jgi:hypothetical protein